jgi:hypothetical protein
MDGSLSNLRQGIDRLGRRQRVISAIRSQARFQLTRIHGSASHTNDSTSTAAVKLAGHARQPQRRVTEKDRAELAVEGVGANAVLVTQFSPTLGNVALEEAMVALTRAAKDVESDNLAGPISLLASQMVALNAIFTHLALIAAKNLASSLPGSERALRLGLKAQSQCRATVETLALIKNPPAAVFARQANIAHGPQQVNNGLMPAAAQERASLPRAGNTETDQSELLRLTDGTRLDEGAAQASGAGDSALAPVGIFDRATQR